MSQDYIQAYAHFSVAAAIFREDDGVNYAPTARDIIAQKLNPDQLERAQKAAKELWEKITNRWGGVDG